MHDACVTSCTPVCKHNLVQVQIDISSLLKADLAMNHATATTALIALHIDYGYSHWHAAWQGSQNPRFSGFIVALDAIDTV